MDASNKLQCSKYPRIFKKFKKFKKMIKNAPKLGGRMRTSIKNLNLCLNWKEQCFKALKNGYDKRNGKKVTRRTINIG